LHQYICPQVLLSWIIRNSINDGNKIIQTAKLDSKSHFKLIGKTVDEKNIIKMERDFFDVWYNWMTQNRDCEKNNKIIIWYQEVTSLSQCPAFSRGQGKNVVFQQPWSLLDAFLLLFFPLLLFVFDRLKWLTHTTREVIFFSDIDFFVCVLWTLESKKFFLEVGWIFSFKTIPAN
jgi:hypothetical protein